MELIDNITRLLGDDLKATLKPKSRLKIAASCFSMYAFEALKAELEKIDELSFIFTSPTFTASEVTDKIRKERKEFHIPKLDRERSLYGSEFEIQLRNKLTQRAIAKECADWMRRKARFKSNRTKAPMQPFAVVQANGVDTAYMPLHGFTAVDLGYQPGNAVSNLVNKMDEPAFAATYLSLFDQIWNDPEKLEDVTAQICEHIALSKPGFREVGLDGKRRQIRREGFVRALEIQQRLALVGDQVMDAAPLEQRAVGVTQLEGENALDARGARSAPWNVLLTGHLVGCKRVVVSRGQGPPPLQ